MAVETREKKPAKAFMDHITDGIESINTFSLLSTDPEVETKESPSTSVPANEAEKAEATHAAEGHESPDDAELEELMRDLDTDEAGLPPTACTHTPIEDDADGLSSDEMNHEPVLVESSAECTAPGYRPCDESGPVFMPHTDRPRLKVYEIETHGGYDLTTEPGEEDGIKVSTDDRLGGYDVLGSTGLGLGLEVPHTTTQIAPDVKINPFTGEEIPTLLDLERRVSEIENKITNPETSENHTHHYYLSPGQSSSLVSSAAAADAAPSPGDPDNFLVTFM